MPTITPITKNNPGTAPEVTVGQSASQKAARSRAMAILQGQVPAASAAPSPAPAVNQAQEHPVPNASNVKPEELGAIAGRSKPADPAPAKPAPAAEPAESRQPTNSEGSDPSRDATPTKNEPLSAHFAQLARKEKALRAKDQEIKQREADLLAREEAIKAKGTEVPDGYISKDRLSKETMAVLNELGISYEQITQEALNAPSPEIRELHATIDELRSKIATLEETQSNAQKSDKDRQQRSYEQAVNHIRREAQQVVANNPDFELVKETGSVEDVVELIKATYDEEGRLMTVEEAAREVEAYLVEEAERLARTAKIRSRLNPPAAPKEEQPPKEEAAPKQPPTQQSQPARTLTNGIQAARPLTSRERAIAAFERRKQESQ